MSDLYNETLLSSPVPGAPQIRVSSCALETASGRRYLDANLRLVVQSAENDIRTEMTIPLDPGTMRAMARVLSEHAARITGELMAIIHQARPDPEAAPLVPGQEFA